MNILPQERLKLTLYVQDERDVVVVSKGESTNFFVTTSPAKNFFDTVEHRKFIK